METAASPSPRARRGGARSSLVSQTSSYAGQRPQISGHLAMAELYDDSRSLVSDDETAQTKFG